MMYNSEWYQNLVKPYAAPPDWVFAPVWIVLYLLMAAALVFYIVKPAERKTAGYVFFALQLILNLMWTPVFFAEQNMAAALVIIILTDIFAFLALLKFYKVSKPAGILLIPYHFWLLFALYLNFGYLLLNS